VLHITCYWVLLICICVFPFSFKLIVYVLTKVCIKCLCELCVLSSLVQHRCLDAKDRSGGKKLCNEPYPKTLSLLYTHSCLRLYTWMLKGKPIVLIFMKRCVCVNACVCVWERRGNTFCKSWDPEYFEAIDFISPPNAEAQSFTLLGEEEPM